MAIPSATTITKGIHPGLMMDGSTSKRTIPELYPYELYPYEP